MHGGYVRTCVCMMSWLWVDGRGEARGPRARRGAGVSSVSMYVRVCVWVHVGNYVRAWGHAVCTVLYICMHGVMTSISYFE